MRRKEWSNEEKDILNKLYEKYGMSCFDLVPKTIPGREAKDARQVWKYHLKTDVIKTAFTDEERQKIKELRESGMRWSEMERHFNGRDQIRLRNEHRKIKRHERSSQVIHHPKEKKEEKEKEEAAKTFKEKYFENGSQNIRETIEENEITSSPVFEESEIVLFSSFEDFYHMF
jgi:hypothetical protein